MLKDRITQIFDRLLPTKKATTVNDRYEPTFIGSALDVDRVHQIMRDAECGNTEDLMSLYRDMILSDSHIQTEFSKRKLAVLGDALSILPVSHDHPADTQAANASKQLLDTTPSFLRACVHLLDAALYPVAVVEKIYRAAPDGSGWRYNLADLVPVPHRLLSFRDGRLQISDTDPAGMKLSTTHDPDPERYIVHRGHLLTTPDNWGGPMRSLVFWWLLSAMDRDWWARFLERYGAPFTVAKYDPNDNAARSKLSMALAAATRLFGVVVTKGTEIDLVQASASQSGDAFDQFLSVCNREKSKLILGQTLSADSQPTGLGSGVAAGHEAVRGDIRQWDALMLGTTLRDQLLVQWLAINGLPGTPPRISWTPEAGDVSEATGHLVASLAQAGIELTDPALQILGERIGLELRRAVTAPSLFASSPDSGVLTLSASTHAPRRVVLAERAGDEIAREGSASLALAFRGSLAPIRRLIAESTSAEDLQQRITAFYADWSPARVAPLIEEALIAYAANGAVVHPPPSTPTKV